MSASLGRWTACCRLFPCWNRKTNQRMCPRARGVFPAATVASSVKYGLPYGSTNVFVRTPDDPA